MVTFKISLKQQAHQDISHSENCLTKSSSWQSYYTEWAIKPSNWRSPNSVTYSHCHRIEIPSCSWWPFEIEQPLLFPVICIVSTDARFWVDIWHLLSVFSKCWGRMQSTANIYHTESIWFSANVHSYHHNSMENLFFFVGFMSVCYSKSARTYTQIPKYQ